MANLQYFIFALTLYGACIVEAQVDEACFTVRCARCTRCERGACVFDDTQTDCTNPCATVLCPEEKPICELHGSEAECVAKVEESESPCNLVDCTPDRAFCEVVNDEAKCEKQCHLSIQSGTCKAHIPMFAWDRVAQKCKRFIYGGCEGNNNRFVTLRECEQTCNSTDAYQSDEVTSPNNIAQLGCPPLNPDMAGICVEACSSDSSCALGEKCCSNGCGHVCMAVVHVPPMPSNCAAVTCLTGQKCKVVNGAAKCIPAGIHNENPGDDQCPDGQSMVNCFVAPCSNQASECPNAASCVDNYCGGCNAIYMDAQKRIMTQEQCENGGLNCPQYKLPAPPVGCEYQYEFDNFGCRVNPHLTCNNATVKPCPAYNLMIPDQGCFYNWTKDIYGCELPYLVCLLKCNKARQEQEEKNSTFLFKCADNGIDYSKKQCYDDECWCVDARTGIEIKGSRSGDDANLQCDEVCSDNEHYKCSTACELNCQDALLNGTQRNCTKQCIRGCYCNDGLYRNRENKCVPLDECKNENPSGPCPIVDVDPYVPGCTYTKVVDDRGCIVPKLECDNATACQTGEEWAECDAACPRTCDNVLNPDEIILCTLQCISRCACVAGKVRGPDGSCIDESECKNNQQSNVPNPCDNVTCPNDIQCQVRNGVASCLNGEISEIVPPTLIECGDNEERVNCGTDCPATCEDIRHPTLKICLKICYPNVCRCKSGYALDEQNNCISHEECLASNVTSSLCESVTCKTEQRCEVKNGKAECVGIITDACDAIKLDPCTTCVTTSTNKRKILPDWGPKCCQETIVNCFISPCQSAKISNKCPEAVHCRDSYCGGCIAQFYNADYNQICQEDK